MAKVWYEATVFQSACATLREELPHLRRRRLPRNENETVHRRRRRSLKGIDLIFRLVPNAALVQLEPGIWVLLIEPFLNTERYTRGRQLHYIRTETGDGFGYISQDKIILKSAEDFDKELLTINPDKVAEHFRSQSPGP